MSMFKKIKRIFIEEDEALIAAEKSRRQDDKSDEEIIVGIPDIEESTDQELNKPFQPSGGVDEAARNRFIDILLKAIDVHNREGFDYLEYKNSLQNLSKMNMDEATRYKSAMAMATTLNVSPEKILESAREYLEVLKKEEVKFKNTVQRQKNIKVSNKEKEIERKKQWIQEKYREIEKIKADIKTAETDLEKQSTEINEDAAKIQSTYENFLHAYSIVSGQINKDIQKISEYTKS